MAPIPALPATPRSHKRLGPGNVWRFETAMQDRPNALSNSLRVFREVMDDEESRTSFGPGDPQKILALKYPAR